MGSKSKSSSSASAISDRSGFKFPMRDMVIEPGTNWLVHKSESDGMWSLNTHPLNNLDKYLRGKKGDPFTVKNARLRPDYGSGVPVYEGKVNMLTQYRITVFPRELNSFDFNISDFLQADWK